MPEIPPIYNTKRIAIFLTLVTLLASVYMFTYSGRIESSDTLGLFDATSSLVQYGDGLLDSSAWYTYPPPSASGQYPLVWTNSEPLQPILAMPLFWVAYHLPGVGLVHAVWLFNILVCSVAGGVFYLYALVLGYGELTAVLGALLLGLCTIIWPYSKTFFREPLALLMILLAALFIECWRLRGYRSWVLLFAALLSLAGGYFSKEAVVFAVPALLVIAAPEFRVSSWVRRVFVVGGAAITSVFIVVSIFPTLFDLTSVYTLIANVSGLSLDTVQRLHTALHSYLLSVGGSVWATSPILLLAVPGLWLLYRRGAYRYLVVVLLMLFTFSVGYAVLRGVYWFGGLSWPPRFLIPAVPILAVGILPALERIVSKPARRWLLVLLAILVLYSIWVQLSGILLPWSVYGQLLPPEAGSLGEWGGGLNQIEYLRWVLLPSQWSQQPLDLAWVRVNVPLWPVMFGTLTVVSGLILVIVLTPIQKIRRFRPGMASGLLIAFLLFTWLGLRGIYPDPYYLGDRPALHDMVSTHRINRTARGCTAAR